MTTMNDRERIGELIREARKKRGLTQGQLSDLCGLKQTTISKIESGKFNASVDLLSKILKPLGYELSIREAL